MSRWEPSSASRAREGVAVLLESAPPQAIGMHKIYR
jgi:hypothetical protein